MTRPAERFRMCITHIPEIDVSDDDIRGEMECVAEDGRIERVDWDTLTIDRDPPLDGLPETAEGHRVVLVTVMAVKPSSSGS